MNAEEENEINQAAYRQLRESIDRDYPAGRFVAIWEGRIVADGASFQELHELLNSMGLRSPNVLVVQSGAEYFDYVDIL